MNANANDASVAAQPSHSPVDWQSKQIRLRWSVSNVCLFRTAFSARVHRCRFSGSGEGAFGPGEMAQELSRDIDCAVIFGSRAELPARRLQTTEAGLLYVMNRTENYFIDTRGTFEEYLQTFSAKTRATIQRKVRKFAQESGGHLDFRVYRTPDEMTLFHQQARTIAAKTYQERLFQGAIPASREFLDEASGLAAQNRVRAFLLFQQDRPIAYLYTPIDEAVAQYDFLGYDPDFAGGSPGTVLLYLAIEHMFREQVCSYFDFGYGNNQTKTTFCTGSFPRADLYLFRRSIVNSLLVRAHAASDVFSETCGRVLDRMGARTAVRRFLRFGR